MADLLPFMVLTIHTDSVYVNDAAGNAPMGRPLYANSQNTVGSGYSAEVATATPPLELIRFEIE